MNIELLYREVIMEHHKNPRNKGLIAGKGVSIPLSNPSCGDEIIMQFEVKDNIIKRINHEGKGCSICCASASVLSESLVNLNLEEAQKVISEFYEMIKGLPYDNTILKNDLLAFSGVSKLPARIKCATLAWKALEKGILSYESGKEENK